MAKPQTFSYRVLENGHVFLWLIKDTCWALGFKAGGGAMIVPTLGMAIYLTWRSRDRRPELFHNIAVCIWILANCIWMLGEFVERDKAWRPYIVTCFLTGFAILLFYYLVYFAKDRKAAEITGEGNA